jgi:hypothetical protein
MNEGNYVGDSDVGDVGDVGDQHVIDWLHRIHRAQQTDETDTTDKTDETDIQKEETKENPILEKGELFTEETDTWTLYGYRAKTQTVDKKISETIEKMQTEPKPDEKLIDEDTDICVDTTAVTETGNLADEVEEKEKLRLSKRKEIDDSIKKEEVIYVLGMTICFVFCVLWETE